MTVIRIAEPQGHFRVTFDCISGESAECGDHQACGWIDSWGCPVDDHAESEWDLRDLRDHLIGCHPEGDGGRIPDTVSFDPGTDWWLDPFWNGIRDSVTDPDDLLAVTAYLHRPGWITDGSWLRVLRYLGWRDR